MSKQNRILQTAIWANYVDGGLQIDTSEGATQMAKSQVTGTPLLSRNRLGMYRIRFAPGEGVSTHTHDGDHMLLVLAGGAVRWNMTALTTP